MLPERKLNAQQNAILQLSAIIAAVHFETNDAVTKQFITMMASQVAAEYQQDSQDPLAPSLFLPVKLTEVFRDAMAKMRTGYELDLKSQKLVHTISKNGKGKND